MATFTFVVQFETKSQTRSTCLHSTFIYKAKKHFYPLLLYVLISNYMLPKVTFQNDDERNTLSPIYTELTCLEELTAVQSRSHSKTNLIIWHIRFDIVKMRAGGQDWPPRVTVLENYSHTKNVLQIQQQWYTYIHTLVYVPQAVKVRPVHVTSQIDQQQTCMQKSLHVVQIKFLWFTLI